MVLKRQQRKAMPKQKVEQAEKNKISKYIKKKPKYVMTKRDNTYVFEGFYEKLKQIDVKHAHSLDANFTYDKLMEERDLIDAGEDGEIFKSNFIQLLRSEKANNKTIEFGKVYTDIERFCFSYPLLIHNKSKIVERLLFYLSSPESQKVIQAGVIDLFIALIKDFRSDIYDDFMKQIMPSMINALDISNVTLLDKVFTLLSFAIKYLTKSIKEDLANFYQMYIELLGHKNRFVRKFAAQSFCYIIRKLSFDEKLLNILIKPITLIDENKNHTFDKIVGISELLFEVVYGASEGLHSKAKDSLNQLLSYQSESRSENLQILVRCLIIKLVNEVDTEKHQLIYDSITKNLQWKESENDLCLLLTITQDIIKLKHGRRVSLYGIVAMIEFLNYLLQSQLQRTLKMSLKVKVSIAETLNLLYYYKQYHVLQVFQKSNLDFTQGKHLFNHYIYQLASDQSMEILKSYFKLFMLSNNEVAQLQEIEDDIDFVKILGLKQSQRNQMEFSQDSHRMKLKMLIKSLNKHILKQIANPEVNDFIVIEHLGLFEILAHQLGEALAIEVAGSGDVELRLISLLNSKQIQPEQQYIIFKFISRCKSSSDMLTKNLTQTYKNSAKKLSKTHRNLDISQLVRENFLLKNYELSDQSINRLQNSILQVIDIKNSGDVENIQYQIEALQCIFLQRNQHNSQDKLIDLLLANPSDIVSLRAFNQLSVDNKLLDLNNNDRHGELFRKVSANLMQNQRELRLYSLRVLAKKFEKLNSKASTEEKIIKSEIIEMMLQFEEYEIVFENEKAKILQIERIKSQLESEAVPKEYLTVIYEFLIGSFWIRFTPFFPYAQETTQLLIRENRDLFLERHLILMEDLSYMTQITHDNDSFMKLLGQVNPNKSTELSKRAHQQETYLSQDFMDVKDFFYNIGKSLCVATIMDSKEFRPKFGEIFFNFIDREYSPLHFSKNQMSSQSLLDSMTYANMVDSESHKQYRRQAYSKLYCFLELLQRADNLKKFTRSDFLQALLMKLLNTNDSKLQKLSLDCLLKSDTDGGVLRQYRKLLEGFTDDIKFKDMIPIVNFGSQTGSGIGNTATQNEDEAPQVESKKEAKANNIPKLAEQHRIDVLPVIIKLLLSKLIKKKGAINKKTVHTRRTIVYQFMSQLNPQVELKLFFNELLSTFNVTIDDECLLNTQDSTKLREKLSASSFNAYLNFIGSFSIIIKQMGSLLARNGYLEKLTFVFIQVLSLTKMFIKHLKLSLAEGDALLKESSSEESEDEQMKESEITAQVGIKDALYRFVGHQSKVCMRKGLAIVKQLYDRYSNTFEYIKDYSKQVYSEIIKDQLASLNTNFISDRSQLMEIVTISWSQSSITLQNFLDYPLVMQHVLQMLSESKINPEVYELHLQMLKSIIMKSIQGLEEKRDLAFLYKKGQQRRDEDDQGDALQTNDVQEETAEREISQKILSKFIPEIAQGLNGFCANHLADLKKTLISRTQYHKKRPTVMGYKPTPHEIKNQTIKDLIFVMSEVANYLSEGDALNQNFLEMTVSVIGMRNLHQESSYNAYFEELLHFGCKSVTNLINKVPSVSDALIDKIYQMFLSLKSLRIRNAFSQGLQLSLADKCEIKPEVLQTVANLNKLRRGAADMELDYDLVIKTIQQIIESGDAFSDKLKPLELQIISFNILHLLLNEEFSVRDFANHFIKQVLLEKCLKDRPNPQLLQTVELILLKALASRIQDEMILKTLLDTMRHYINFLKVTDAQDNHLKSLQVLINIKDDNDDFFVMFLAIKMKSRQRALKMAAQRLSQVNNFKAIQQVVMPLINYVIFGNDTQKQNRRNTISYTREERATTLEEALNFYQSLAHTLKWSDYFRLLKTLLFRLQRLSNKAQLQQIEGGGSADEELVAQEKTVTKCICRVLNGFNFEGIQDAGQVYLEQAGNAMADSGTSIEFDEVLKSVIKTANEDEDFDNEEEEEQAALIKDDDEIMETEGGDQKVDIQRKLYQKILPVLERHMMDAKDTKKEDSQPTIRSFVVLSIVKLLRKLPVHTFQNSLSKLVSTIVSKGLRQRELTCREKGRKALLKIIQEMTPRAPVLSMVFQEIKDQLQKGGYQLHTFSYSIHFLLQQLHEQRLLKAGDISTNMVDILSDKFLEELFNTSTGTKADGTLEDVEKVKIKESKTKKSIPVFELFSQYMDFKSTFFNLLAPVMRALEDNPTITKLQLCEELLSRLSNSLLKNESVKTDELLLFVYTIIQRGVTMAVKIKINDDRAERDYGAKKKEVFARTKQQYKEMTYSVEMRWKKTGQQLNDKKTQEICGRVLGTFGLQCLKKALKSTQLILKDQQKVDTLEQDSPNISTEDDLKAKLDPFVSVLLDAFKTYHNPITVATLHVLGLLIPLGLPTFKELMKKLLNKLFKLFESTGPASNNSDNIDFLNSLFRCTAELIRTYATFQDLTQPQLRTLVHLIKQHLNSNSTQTNVFHCLRAIVYRKFVCADLYDLVENVQDLMITSLAKSTRGICAQIFTQFLLDYPLEPSRLEQHLNHLLKNLGYFDSEGRLQVLEIIQHLTERFPRDLLDQYAELIFFTLMLRAVNETNTKCRAKVSQVIRRLAVKCSQAKAKTLFNTVCAMDVKTKPQVGLAKMVVMGALIEETVRTVQEAQRVAEACIDVVQAEALKLVEAANEEESSESEDEQTEVFDDTVQNPEMKQFLQNIDLIEDDNEKPAKKLTTFQQAALQAQQFTIDFEEEKNQSEWSSLYYSLENLEKLLSQTQVGYQILGKIAQGLIPNLLLVGLQHQTYWIRLGVQRVFGAIFSQQMKQNLDINKSLGLQQPKEIVDMIFKLLNVFRFPHMLNEELGTQLVKNLTFLLKTALTDDKFKAHLNLSKLFGRVSFLARKMMLNVQKAKDKLPHVLLFFQVTFSLLEQLSEGKLDNELSRLILEPVLDLLYRVNTDTQYENTQPKTLTLELIDQLSAGIDKAHFINTYNSVKASVHKKRLDRKRVNKIKMASAEGAALKERKRDRKNLKKKEQKRQKILQFELRKN